MTKAKPKKGGTKGGWQPSKPSTPGVSRRHVTKSELRRRERHQAQIKALNTLVADNLRRIQALETYLAVETPSQVVERKQRRDNLDIGRPPLSEFDESTQ